MAAGGIFLAVVAILVRALLRGPETLPSGAVHDMAVYRDQLAEIDRDVARGILPEAEAERLRTEVSRRLLEADRAARTAQPMAARGAAPVAAVVVALALAAGAGLYALRLGAPGYPDLPLAERLAMTEEVRASRPSQAEAEARAELPPPRTDVDPEFLDLMEKLRTTMAERPDDLRGLELLARNEAALGNLVAAREAQARIVALKGTEAEAEDHARLAELMVVAAGGLVSPEAEAELVQALTLDPRHGLARYYSGLMFAQIGRYDRAFSLWRGLLEGGPQDAPWVGTIRADLPEIAARAGVNYTLPEPPSGGPGPSAADIEAAAGMEAGERQAMIEGMVEQLGARLASEGGPAEDWARMISSLAVLGRTEQARAILAEAETRFEGRSADLAFIREAALNAGVLE
jgi:cytochrome c-type biogenesis protein CcmH